MPNVTTFEEIYALFLDKVQDWKHRNLFLSDAQVATNLCKSYLFKAIAKFDLCKKIQHPNEELAQFEAELSIKEKDILTGLMVEAWMDRVCLDITQMSLTLSDSDFKHYSEEKNLREKTETRDKIREINAQDMWKYDFDNTSWTEWAGGNYGL